MQATPALDGELHADKVAKGYGYPTCTTPCRCTARLLFTDPQAGAGR